MSFIIALVPLFILVLIVSVFLKSAALVTRISLFWRHCFAYGGLVVVIAIALNAVSIAFNYTPPQFIALLIAGLFHLALGTWYISKYGIIKDGSLVSAGRAVATVFIFLFFLSLFVGGLMLLLAGSVRQIAHI